MPTSAPIFPPCPAPFNLATHALAAATRCPDKSALQVLRPAGAECWSYARLEAAVRGAGTGFLARGLQPGDRVLLRLGNSAAFPVAYLGAIAAGLVPVPTSSALTQAEITPMARAVSPALIVADEGIALPDLALPLLTGAALLRMESLPPCAWDMGSPDRLAYILFTSGTSGRPLAVAHAHRAIWARGMMQAGWEGLGPQDRLLHAGAMNWSFTLGTGLLDPWVSGATALIPAPGVEVGQLPLLLRRFDATIFAAAPGIYRQMLRQPLPALPRLRHGLSAGETLPPELRRHWRAATGTDIHEAIGLSECSTFVSGSPGRPAPEGSTGYPQPGRRIAVLADGQPAPQGTLAVHRSDPGLMLGYWGDPEVTARRFAGDWFLTGDVVAADPDGALRYLGREDDQMNAGGFRVSPLEVETAMAACPGIGEVAVTEVEVRPGVRVIACFHTGAAEDPAGHAARHLARWKAPRLFIRLDALPRNANNKLNRRALAALVPQEGR